MPLMKEYFKNKKNISKKSLKTEGIRRPYLDDIKLRGHVLLEIKNIEKNPYQPRKVFAKESLQDLANSILEKDVLQPILVRRIEKRYQLIAGERRLEASKLLGKKEIKALIKEDVSDQDMLEIGLIENIQRENLSAIEIAETYGRLKAEFNLKPKDISKKVGKELSVVHKYLQINAASPLISEAAKKHNLKFRTLVELLKIEKITSENDFLKLLKNVLDQKITSTGIAKLIVNIKAQKEKRVLDPSSKKAKYIFTETKKSIKFSINIKKDETNNVDKEKIKEDVGTLLKQFGFNKVIIE